MGIVAAAREAVEHLVREELDGFWIHVDADCLEDAVMPAVDFRLPGGLLPEQLKTVLTMALDSGSAVGLERSARERVVKAEDSKQPSRSLTQSHVRSTTMSTTALFISHRAKPGKRDELKTVWLKHMAPAIGANPGHLAYVYSYDARDEDVVHAFQHYASEAAAAGFLKNPSYLAYLEESRPLLEREPEIKVLSPQWSKAA